MAEADGRVTIVLDADDRLTDKAKRAQKYLEGLGKNAGNEIATSTEKNMGKAEKSVNDGKSSIDNKLKSGSEVEIKNQRALSEIRELTDHLDKVVGPKESKVAMRVTGENELKDTESTVHKLDGKHFRVKGDMTGRLNTDVKVNKKSLDEMAGKHYNVKINGTGNAKEKVDGLNRSVKQTERSTSRLKDIIAGSFISSVAIGGLNAIKNAMQSVITTGLEFNREQDTMKTVWHSLTTEAPRDGKVLIDFINSTSQHSIYAASTLDKMAQSFYHVHSNAQETKNWTKDFVALGSTLHMSNEGLAESGEQFAKIVAGGKASAEDMSVMINRFPMFGEALQKATGKSMKQLYAMSAAGKLTATQFTEALTYLGKKYRGGTKEAMTSFQGMTMYLKSRWQVLTGDITKSAFNMNKDMLTDMRNLLSDNMMKKYASLASDAISVVTGAAVKMIKYLDEHKDTILDIIGNLGKITGIIGETIWLTFGEILGDIGRAFGLISDKGNDAKSPLDSIDDILKAIASNRQGIENVTRALIAMFAIKKIASFITGVKGIASAFGLVKVAADKAAVSEAAAAAVDNGATKLTLGEKVGSMATKALGPVAGLTGGTITVSGLMAIAGAAIAVGVAAYGIYRAKKYTDSLRDSVDKTQSHFDHFGTHVSDGTAKAVSSINDKFQDIKGDMALLDTGTSKDAKRLSSDISDKYVAITKTLVSKIKSEASEAKSNLSSSLTGLGAIKGNLSVDTTGVDANKAIKKVQSANVTIQKIVKDTGGDLSKMTAAQTEAYNKANDTLAYYTSGLARSEQDQQSLLKEYSSKNTKLSADKYEELSANADKYYSAALKKAHTFVASNEAEAKKLYDSGLINSAEYQARMARFSAQEQGVVTKAVLKRQATQEALNKSYDNTGRTNLYSGTKLSDSYSSVLGAFSNKAYKSLVTGQYETKQKWIEETKRQNEQYLNAEKLMYTQDTKLGKNGQLEYKSLVSGLYVDRKTWLTETQGMDAQTIRNDLKRNANSSATLKKYVRDQTKAYESAGHSRKVALAQAKVDADELVAQTNKTAKRAEEAGKKQAVAFAKGLAQKGTTSARNEIKKWGIDITNSTKKIDFGKYGQATGTDFWKEFRAGTAKGYGMARVYFQEQLDSSGKTLHKYGSKQVSEFKSGLKAGVVSLKSLKSQFGSSIMNLFPSKGLTKLGRDDVKLLKQGLKDGSISDSMMKKKFGHEYDVLFKRDLSKLGKNDLKTLTNGLKSGIINKNDLAKRYKKDLDKIYDHDLSKVGKKTLKSLAEGYRLGLPEADKQMKALEKLVGDKTKIDVRGHAKQTMAGLNKLYKDGQITTSEYLDDLQRLLRRKTNISLKKNGSKTSSTYNTGFKDNFGAIFGNAHDLASGVNNRMNPGKHGKPYSNGKTFAQTFDDGLVAKASAPLGTSAKIAKKTASNFNSAGDASDSLSSELGGSKSKHKTITAPNLQYHFANGTNGGRISTLTHAMVNDGRDVSSGGNKEIILHNDGRVEPIYGRDVMKELLPGEEVLNAEQSEMYAPMLGIKHFASGNFFGNIGSWIKKMFKSAENFIEHPIKNWHRLVDSTFDMNGFGGSKGSEIGNDAKEFEKKQTKWLDELEASGSYDGAKGHYNPGLIAKAASMMHVTMPAGFSKALQTVIQNESGGRSIIQGIHDMNSGGNETGGILQYTPQTFASFAMPDYHNRMNPLDELLAFFNNSDWKNSIGWTTIWGHRKMEWLHSGPQGSRRLSHFANGGVVDDLTQAILGDDPMHRHETIVNEAKPTADGLLSQSISERAKQDPQGLYANLLKISKAVAFGQTSMNGQVSQTTQLANPNDGTLRELVKAVKSAASQGNVFMSGQNVGAIVRANTTNKTKTDAFWAGKAVLR